MNKLKKVAVAAVSIVMAGTMAGSLAACTGGNTSKKTIVRTSIGYQTNDETGISFATTTLPLKQANGNDATTNITLPDGTTYRKGALKPIWQAYEKALDIRISDDWTKDNDNLTKCANEGLYNYDLIGAGSLDSIQKQIDAGTLLNLNDYMDKLPNLKHFIDNNALAELGTLSDPTTGAMYYAPYYGGMNDVERINLFRRDYVSELLDHADLSTADTLNGGTITFKAQADAKKSAGRGARKENETFNGAASSIKAYMGTTGNYIVKTSDPADSRLTVFVKVNYDAAKTAAEDSTKGLGKAIADANGGTAYSGTSGNIVDLQNFVIDAAGGEVAGKHLLNILREYIKVAYEWADSETASTWNKFYGAEVNGVQTKLGDIINAAYGAWDVDIYAAIGRCYVTCGNLLGSYQSQAAGDAGAHTGHGVTTYLFTPRTGLTNRTTRLTAMIGELYGVRGMEGMEYLDSSGTLRQARFNVATWDALMQFSAFHTEGLVPSFNATDAKNDLTEPGSSCNSHYQGDGYYQGLSGNDFLAGQTKNAGLEVTQGKKGDATPGYVQTTDGYDWTSVVTPVSRWLTNDTSTVNAETNAVTATDNVKLSERPEAKTEVMRFTESTLKLKTGGLVIPKSTRSDEKRLNATLALVDYIFSNDGLIETTFGSRSDSDNLTGNDTDGYKTTNNGWWYGAPVTQVKDVNISGKSMAELAQLGVVETYDDGKQYTMTKEYQAYAIVYKNKLYRTGTNGGDYDNGYVYNGAMTPYYTRAVRKLCEGDVAVNGFKSNGVISDVNLKNKLLGQEGFGVVNNSSAVQLYSDMAIPGADVVSAALGNGSIQTVSQDIGDNPWFTCPPSVTLPKSSSDTINTYADFTTLFKTGSSIANYFILEVGWFGTNYNFSDFNTVTNKNTTVTTPEGMAAYIKGLAPQYENLRNAAWAESYSYYVNKGASAE